MGITVHESADNKKHVPDCSKSISKRQATLSYTRGSKSCQKQIVAECGDGRAWAQQCGRADGGANPKVARNVAGATASADKAELKDQVTGMSLFTTFNVFQSGTKQFNVCAVTTLGALPLAAEVPSTTILRDCVKTFHDYLKGNPLY
jgi:hypothetical protein